MRVLVDPDEGGAAVPAARLLARELGGRVGEEVAVAATRSLSAPAGDVLLTSHLAPARCDEAFRLEVGDSVVLRARGERGALHAAAQVLQNVHVHASLARGVVESWPEVPERGLHLDIARHRFGEQWIKARLRSMAAAGLNALQLHFSENEGVGILAPSMPELASPDALRPGELAAVLELAEDLHIAVIPSLDMPGHLGAVLAHWPGLRLRDARGAAVPGALDLGQQDAWDLTEALIDAYAPLFPHADHWMLGCDEFIDFDAVERYPRLEEAAQQRHGPGATAFDLLTGFANHLARHLSRRGMIARVWNDGMSRSSRVPLAAEVEIAWWTNWSSGMAPLSSSSPGRRVLNFDDQHLYHVLGEHAGYRHPTATRLWEDAWHPGMFTPLPGGVRQGLPTPDPLSGGSGTRRGAKLGGAFASLWCDLPDAESEEEVAASLDAFLPAFGERAWNGGSQLDLEQFRGTASALRGFHLNP